MQSKSVLFYLMLLQSARSLSNVHAIISSTESILHSHREASPAAYVPSSNQHRPPIGVQEMNLGLQICQSHTLLTLIRMGRTYRVLDLASLVANGILCSRGTGAHICAVVLCDLCDLGQQ